MWDYFIECGYGNATWLSTEIEYPDGTEARFPGIRWPQHFSGCYLRFWMGYVVVVLSPRGLSVVAKRRWAFKLLLGLQGYRRW